MKTYYIHLHSTDFDKDGLEWVGPVIDLYDTHSAESEMATPGYRNYSATKSPRFGTDLLGDQTWTGLSYEDATPATPTDTGFVYADRYIDTSGRIEIVDWIYESADRTGPYADIQPHLHVHHIDDLDLHYPTEWASQQNIAENRAILIRKAFRYAKFSLTFSPEELASNTWDTFGEDEDGPFDIDIFVRVRIDVPVMAPLYDRTLKVQEKFPEWMAMREVTATPNDDLVRATQEPVSLGGKLLNAVAGQWLDEIESDISYTGLQRFISTADLGQAAWVYFASDIPDYIYKVALEDGTLLTNTPSLREFYELGDDEHGYHWDRERGRLYINFNDSIFLNDVEYETEAQQIWNWFDEFGLNVDLYRHFLEDNDSFKNRILDVYHNKPGVGLDAFKLALRRELNLWATEDATPHWSYDGATPTVLEIPDIEDHEDFMTPDGLPTEKFRLLVEELATKYPTTWGYFKWNQAFWDIGGIKERSDGFGDGFDVLPHTYDASPNLPYENTQSGVGHGNDLYLFRPDEFTGAKQFEAELILRGYQKSFIPEYPKLVIDAYVYGRANRRIYDNPIATTWVTIILEDTLGNLYYNEREIEVQSGVDVDTPAPTYDGMVVLQWASEGQTMADLEWINESWETLGGSAATPFIFSEDEIANVTVHLGRTNPLTQTRYDLPTDLVTAWLGTDINTTIETGGAVVSYLTVPTGYPEMIFIRSEEVSYTVGKWETEKHPIKIVLNGGSPQNIETDYTHDVPRVVWDSYLTAPVEKEYVVELTSTDTDGVTFGGWTTDADGSALFVTSDAITVNGSNAWSGGRLFFSEVGVTQLTWSSGTQVSPAYPIQAPTWTLFEARQTVPIPGIVDENGPWRNNQAPPPGNDNFNLTTLYVDRDDFGIAHTDDYYPTWMGVEVVDGDRVIVWLDSNTVNPAPNDSWASIPELPPNGIEELYDGSSGEYYFSPFVLRARLKPGVSPQWYPQIHSGWFYDQQDEYYLYAEPGIESATVNDWVLQDVVRQGAPILVEAEASPNCPVQYRQVAFQNPDSPTPSLSTIAQEVLSGTGTNQLYLAYPNVYDVDVFRNYDGLDFTVDTESTSNVIEVLEATDKDLEYTVTYKLKYSFYADNEYVDAYNNLRTKLVFDTTSTPNSATPVDISYETSIFDPATPVAVPLNAFYTTQDEGFVYISHEEYPLHEVQARLSPSKVLSDGMDYLLVTLKSIDINGNPKPFQEFNLQTDFGTWGDEGVSIDITTDLDGFAVATLVAGDVAPDDRTGTIAITGALAQIVQFQIEEPSTFVEDYNLVSLTTADAVPADGVSGVSVYGQIRKSDHATAPYAAIRYRRGRSMYEVFNQPYPDNIAGDKSATPVWPDSGKVYADQYGDYVIGPFESATPESPGYWFIAVESFLDATPAAGTPTGYAGVGDVSYWYEYPEETAGIDPANELPRQSIQLRDPVTAATPLYSSVAFPVSYDDATPLADATPGDIIWEPPTWYAIQKYKQYQMGLLGTEHYELEQASVDGIHPHHRDY